jgi:hypothetical protein
MNSTPETVYAIRHRITGDCAAGYYGFVKDVRRAKFYRNKGPATSIIKGWRKRLAFAESMNQNAIASHQRTYYHEDAIKVREWLDNAELVKCERTLMVVELLMLPL